MNLFSGEGHVMCYSAAIFDLDGTLLDTLQDLADSANQMLVESGYPQHPTQLYRHFVGDGVNVLVQRIVPSGLEQQQKDRCIGRFLEIYAGRWRRNSCPYPGINAMLAGLKNAGIRLAVLSNKPHAFTLQHVEHFFPGGIFEIVFGHRPGVAKKPDPVGLLEIAARMEKAPSVCCYVGDTAVDMQTGRGAGMYTIGVLWGFRNRQELEDNQADKIVHTPLEIVQHAVHSL